MRSLGVIYLITSTKVSLMFLCQMILFQKHQLTTKYNSQLNQPINQNIETLIISESVIRTLTNQWLLNSQFADKISRLVIDKQCDFKGMLPQIERSTQSMCHTVIDAITTINISSMCILITVSKFYDTLNNYINEVLKDPNKTIIGSHSKF